MLCTVLFYFILSSHLFKNLDQHLFPTLFSDPLQWPSSGHYIHFVFVLCFMFFHFHTFLVQIDYFSHHRYSILKLMMFDFYHNHALPHHHQSKQNCSESRICLPWRGSRHFPHRFAERVYLLYCCKGHGSWL